MLVEFNFENFSNSLVLKDSSDALNFNDILLIPTSKCSKFLVTDLIDKIKIGKDNIKNLRLFEYISYFVVNKKDAYLWLDKYGEITYEKTMDELNGNSRKNLEELYKTLVLLWSYYGTDNVAINSYCLTLFDYSLKEMYENYTIQNHTFLIIPIFIASSFKGHKIDVPDFKNIKKYIFNTVTRENFYRKIPKYFKCSKNFESEFKKNLNCIILEELGEQ
ncbi:MAG: hypothetical protein QW727_04085 [Candidatus Pacearchaeota archaeon]